MALVSLAAAPTRAEVVRVDVTTRQDVLGGRPFGTAYFTLDPKNSRNDIKTLTSRASQSR